MPDIMFIDILHLPLTPVLDALYLIDDGLIDGVSSISHGLSIDDGLILPVRRRTWLGLGLRLGLGLELGLGLG